MKYLTVGILAFSMMAAACEDPAANKTKATVSEPASNSAANSATNAGNSVGLANAPATVGEALVINSENSKVEFTGSKVTGKHEGGFKSLIGTIGFVNSKPEESVVTVDIDTASVYSDDEKLTGHLKSADFFLTSKSIQKRHSDRPRSSPIRQRARMHIQLPAISTYTGLQSRSLSRRLSRPDPVRSMWMRNSP